ncbi:MAG: ABC transporter permease [Christensenellales bacterium]
MNTNSGKLRQKLKFNKFPFGVYLLLVAVIVVFFAATQGTISPAHLMNIVRQSAPLGVAAMGQTIVLLVGGIDLSVGATMSMVNLVAASVMGGSDAQILPALLICMALCLLVGLLNGYIIATFKMQPFLVTMAMSMIIEGGYYIYTKGIAKGSIATGIRFISEGWIGIVPIAAIIWLVIWLVLSVVLHHTPYGHRLYITGGNQDASRLSGFKSKEIVISAYVLCSLLAGIGGLLLSAYIGTASTGVGAVIRSTRSLPPSSAARPSWAASARWRARSRRFDYQHPPEPDDDHRHFGGGQVYHTGIVIAVMVAINQRKRR